MSVSVEVMLSSTVVSLESSFTIWANPNRSQNMAVAEFTQNVSPYAERYTNTCPSLHSEREISLEDFFGGRGGAPGYFDS